MLRFIDGHDDKEKMMTRTEALTANIQNVRQLLESNQRKIAAVLPKHVDADRLMTIALTVVQRTPKLAECDARSLLGACIQSAQVGVSLDPTLGEAYLVPYKRVATFQMGYRGLLKLARNSGEVTSVFAMPVFKGDDYNEEITENGPTFRHVPSDQPGRELRCVYMVAKFKDGGFHWGRMWAYEIDLIRDRSRAGNSGPWVTDYIEMAKKTVVRREAKYLPLSTEAQRAISSDERVELGIDSANVIDLDQGERVEETPKADDQPTEVNTTNDPNSAAQDKLNAITQDLNETHEGQPKMDERGCENCGVINYIPEGRKTFSCEGCNASNVITDKSS